MIVLAAAVIVMGDLTRRSTTTEMNRWRSKRDGRTPASARRGQCNQAWLVPWQERHAKPSDGAAALAWCGLA